MSTSTILGGERAARHSPGKDVDALGPSDSSDSGSDVQGEREMSTDADRPDELGAMPVRGNSDSDAFGSGERGSATGRDDPDNADIVPDHIERAGADADDLAEADRLDAVDVGALTFDDEEPEPQDDLFDERRPRREARRP